MNLPAAFEKSSAASESTLSKVLLAGFAFDSITALRAFYSSSSLSLANLILSSYSICWFTFSRSEAKVSFVSSKRLDSSGRRSTKD